MACLFYGPFRSPPSQHETALTADEEPDRAAPIHPVQVIRRKMQPSGYAGLPIGPARLFPRALPQAKRTCNHLCVNCISFSF
jgi:hypothetical protein